MKKLQIVVDKWMARSMYNRPSYTYGDHLNTNKNKKYVKDKACSCFAVGQSS